MDRSLHITGDGSHTLYINGLDESYHSSHGAIQESMHVFIEQGFLTLNQPSARILELGFGTGLNAILTLKEAQKLKIDVHYHAVEKYPLREPEYSSLNHEQCISGLHEGMLGQLHSCPWEKPVQITEQFTLQKEESDFRNMKLPSTFNLVYFDAFSPDKQPELWTDEVISAIGRVAEKGAILVSYTAKGSVRRTLNSCGFEVHKVPGPPGKREMIRAIKR